MHRIVCSAFLIVMVNFIIAQELPTKINNYNFQTVKLVDRTGVKNQNKSGTCWIFSTHSFLESELMRMGKGEFNLSEMYIARAGYLERGENYVRRQGSTAFGQGAENHDVMRIIDEYGLVPEEAYAGYPDGQDKPIHGEMESVLKAMVEAMVKLPDGKLSPNWKKVYQGAVDGYFGTPPANFTFKGKSYTPQSFAGSLGINSGDYIALTSFTHHPMNKPFILEVADNWSNGMFYNISMDELVNSVDQAIKSGYSVLWATDVSEKTFSAKNGLAINPYMAWEDMSDTERDSLWKAPHPEKFVTQEERQLGFENLSTTDDHGMHIVGIMKDQNGTEYYVVKNSWGAAINKTTGGYIYVSKAYFRNKTMSVMLNKNALNKDLKAKLGL
ncbi:MAG: aminopeptidase [Saprospiraceae bacterium]|nr:aminopeptidase [Candidatus Vicinibacter affinis]